MKAEFGIEILQHRELIETVQYERWFPTRGCNGDGYAFPCDAEGRLLPFSNPDAARNHAACVAGVLPVDDGGIRAITFRGWTDRIGRCRCGAEVFLNHFTNGCDGCGTLYNSAGQELADPSFWGEETGEHPADLLRVR